jgi:hypothetical protein
MPDAYTAAVTITWTDWPFSGPSSSRTVRLPHFEPSPFAEPDTASQFVSVTAVTVPLGIVRPGTASVLVLSWLMCAATLCGHSHTSAATVQIAIGMRIQTSVRSVRRDLSASAADAACSAMW